MSETPHNRTDRHRSHIGSDQKSPRPHGTRGTTDDATYSSHADQRGPRNHTDSDKRSHTSQRSFSRTTIDGRPERRSGSAADRSSTSARKRPAGDTDDGASAYRREADTYRRRFEADRMSRPDPMDEKVARSSASDAARSRFNNRERYRAQRDGARKDSDRSTDTLIGGIRFPLKPAIVAAVVLVCLIGGGILFAQTRPVAVVLNGTEVEVGHGKDIAAIIEEGHVVPQAGDFVAVDGAVLEAGKGKAFTARINGTDVEDPHTKLESGAIVELADGGDIVEDSDDTVIAVPYEVTEEGNGPLHIIEGEGIDGHSTTKVGKVSGKTFVDEADPVNPVCRKYYPDTGDDKVIALTFDDGPWPGSTEQVLDILDTYDAKATFFTLGERFDDKGTSLVKRAYDAGHQICTHSFDHARGEGKSVDLGLMSPEQQIDEITRGYEAIERATGAEASRVIRTPGGNFGPAVAKNLAPYISAEIGWTIDSGDWRLPGSQSIADDITSSWSGAIVLCHDGGGDRSQTVKALDRAIPHLQEQGYRFITIDELMAYPRKDILL